MKVRGQILAASTVLVAVSQPFVTLRPSQARLNHLPDPVVRWRMAEKPQSGSIFGVPYNFERPSVGRLLSSYWQPGKGMLVEKPFGIGYTINLASWRSWIVLAVVAALLWQERQGDDDVESVADDPVEVIIDDD
jgi:hypothetical protein